MRWPASAGMPCISNSGEGDERGCIGGLRCAKIKGDLGDIIQGVATVASLAPPVLYAQGDKDLKNIGDIISIPVKAITGEVCIPEDQCGEGAIGFQYECGAKYFAAASAAAMAITLNLSM